MDQATTQQQLQLSTARGSTEGDSSNRKLVTGLIMAASLLLIISLILISASILVLDTREQIHLLKKSSQSSRESLSIVKNFLEQLDVSVGQLKRSSFLRLNRNVTILQQILTDSLDEIVLAIDSKTQQVNSSITALTEVLSHISQPALSILSSWDERFQVFQENIDNNIAMTTITTQRVNQTLNSSFVNMLRLLNHPQSQCSFVSPCINFLQLDPLLPSGYYWVRTSGGSVSQVYCDMTRSCGGVTGGWMRIAKVDMRESCGRCPSGLREHTYSSIRTCIAMDIGGRTCSSVNLVIPPGISYSHVCGKIKAYQYGSTDAFRYNSRDDINTFYVDGVSLTHGNPRQHIWTFASARDEAGVDSRSNCPCLNRHDSNTLPTFLGNDYFCDTGNENETAGAVRRFHDNDPLWDGAGCGPGNECCSFNNPPWFYKQLPQPTADDVEMRVCRSGSERNENVALESFEIYVR